VNRSMCLYNQDDKFKNELDNMNSLVISGSGF
jgi:hypothetical protein